VAFNHASSNKNPFNFVKRDFRGAAIVKPRRAHARMVRHPRAFFKHAAV
jgi:hypothetical protein